IGRAGLASRLGDDCWELNLRNVPENPNSRPFDALTSIAWERSVADAQTECGSGRRLADGSDGTRHGAWINLRKDHANVLHSPQTPRRCLAKRRADRHSAALADVP